MTTAPYANIAYAPMTVEYDRNRFVYEYDRYILPRSRLIYNSTRGRDATAELNRQWGMIPLDIYAQQDGTLHPSWADCPTDRTSLQSLGNPSWLQAIMTEMIVTDADEPVLKEAGSKGRLAARNFAPEREWQLKSEFAKLNLQLIDFIYNKLCLSRIVWVSCVSLEPGRCAIIHRDSMRLYSHGSNPMLNNGMAHKGYVVVTLNITNGGVPLYWGLDDDVETARFADDSMYLSSDYFLHGVPVVTSRRRQVRVMGVPGAGFDQLIDRGRAVVLPDDYEYRSNEASMY
jgi:hypothetical protein